jgi:outer membrane receptor protein involved in Fe transport
MRTYVSGLAGLLILFSARGYAADIRGKITDPAGAPVPGAQVSLVGRLGVETQTVSGANGSFELRSANRPDSRLVVTAPGFTTRTVPPEQAAAVQLEIAPRVDAIEVTGSAMGVLGAEQGGSVTLVPREEIRRRNEPYGSDFLRYVPGITMNQSGSPGGVSSLFLRGGSSSDGLVQIDGAPVNGFGGAFDFAHIPAEALDHIEVIRGPQSAVYGPYANSGVIDFVTRKPGESAQLDLLAEGGTYRERRFGITASGTAAGFGLLAAASRIDTEGPVANSDYRNSNLLANVTRRFARQGFSLHAGFNSNAVGEPGPWGSNPRSTYSGLDLISRGKNNFSTYSGKYEADLSAGVRQEFFGSFFQNHNGYQSPYGFSFNKDLRGRGESRTLVAVNRYYTAAFGVSAEREQVENVYITDAAFSTFPIRRDDVAAYAENRFEFGGRLFLNAGVRGEWIRTGAMPGDGYSRPAFPSKTLGKVNPKLAAAWAARAGTRLHGSFGMGLRPPSGFELAFTDNPGLAPERSRSVDAGIEQRLFGNLVLLDATWFYNRYYDLIVTLGGSLATLSHYHSDNLANSRAQGGEFTASIRPARSVFVTGSYMLLETRILAVDGAGGRAPLPFTVGQPLTRRPRNSGSIVATYTRGRVTADVTGAFRGRALYEEPSYGASNGLFWNPGYANVGLNLNLRVRRGLTAYGNLRNALNRRYEEVFGYPSARLNFVAGLKWTLAGGR